MLHSMEIELPIGLPIDGEDGGLLQKVSIKKLTGADKIELFGMVQREPDKAAIELVRRLLVEPKLSQSQIINRLTIADRDFIVVEAYRFTKGDEVSWVTNCEFCGAEQQVILDIKTDLELKLPERNLFTNIDGEVRYNFTLPGVGPIELKYGTQREVQAIKKSVQKNPYEGIFKMYSLCLRKWGDVDEPFPVDFIKNTIEYEQMEHLEEKMVEFVFGYSRQSDFDCIDCGKNQSFAIEPIGFFYQTKRKPNKP